MKLFVYGTLRKGQSNNQIIENASIFSAQARIKGKLYDTGYEYPALVLKGDTYVFGEIHEVDDKLLPKLDMLEDYDESRLDNLYYRTKKMIETDKGAVEAWVYVIDHQHEQELNQLVPFQDWSIYQWYASVKEVNYFAYGSCMDLERIEKAGMKREFSNVVGIGTLDSHTMDYLISQNDGGRADIIESDVTDKVEGIIYAVSKKAIDYLFHREGVHSGNYRPILINIQTEQGTLKEVLSFTVIHKETPCAPPKHYSTEILRGAKDRLSAGYYKKLEKNLDILTKNSNNR
ncbi:gamma-glutamylcyclotransferase [Salipaludibacillus neizhouensis]|uniref:Gamma-glutamylcyclotransferase n=1 Tax=Salipaludibacillus neizhouensis TaxID=885475 RepID=A0A3A9KB10_9BACI|nr:gamma-glutamylcyclotransferase family protein [Salipaludibacillus neizhouensis]RKL69339.1 gamma-glutamylcyclotransferase [Salipaludibacillus neizhouensis]